MNTCKIVTTLRDGNGGKVTVTTTNLEADLELDIQRESLEPSDEPVEFDIVFPYQGIKAIGIGAEKSRTIPAQSDVNVELTIKTNNAETPDDEFVITDENGLGWWVGSLQELPFTVDVTAIYVVNTGSAIADFQLKALVDSSPGLDS